MKVLLISPLPPPAGGIATWTLKYVKYFSENNLSCEVVNTAVTGIREKEINHKKNYIEEIKRARDIYLNTKKRVQEYKPDIAHINSSCTKYGVIRDYVVIRLLKHNHVPIVLHCRCNIEDQLTGKLSRVLFSKMVNSSNIVLTLNKQSKLYVESVSSEKAKIIPNFIEKDRIVENRIIKETVKKVLFVGHVWKAKGVLEIVETAKMMPDLNFVLVGPIREDIKKIDYPQNVELTGEKDHDFVKQQLDDADIFLFPSYTEGFANALTEAMAAGLPIITTPVGANEDMIEKQGGIIVPVGDAASIKEAINRMAEKTERERMSQWNIKKVKDYYLISSVMKSLLQVYSEVLYESM